MQSLIRSLYISLTLLLTLLTPQIAATAAAVVQFANGGAAAADSLHLLAARQLQVTCEEYSSLANLSFIAANSTFRSRWMQNSQEGSLATMAVLDDALARYNELALINDTALNDECGNLTEIAMVEAPRNLSMGIVGPYNFGGAARLGAGAGPVVVFAAAMVGAAVMVL